MVIDIVVFILSIILIVFGARFFVNSAVKIAKRMKVSGFVIGLTLIALGTSLPELFSSIVASSKHQSGLIIGTILGANIMDLTLVIGVAALIAGVKLSKHVLKRDIYTMIFAVMLTGIFLLDAKLSRIEGFVFVAIFLMYNFYIFRKKENEKSHKSAIKHIGKYKELNNHLFREIILFVIGGLMLYFGAEGLVREAVLIAENLSVPIIIIGIIISIGTTIPELSVSITSSGEKKGEIAIGNSIGSVITNTLLILGISALIFPISIAQKSINFLMLFLLGVSVLLGILIKTKWKISRIEGVILILIYVLFWILTLNIIL